VVSERRCSLPAKRIEREGLMQSTVSSFGIIELSNCFSEVEYLGAQVPMQGVMGGHGLG
jgi:hypothetical protein